MPRLGDRVLRLMAMTQNGIPNPERSYSLATI